MLCFVEPASLDNTVDSRWGLRRPSFSFLLLNCWLCACWSQGGLQRPVMVSLFTINLFFAGTTHGGVGRGRCSEMSVFQGIAVKMPHSLCGTAASHHREMWIASVNTQKLAVFV